MRKNHMYKDVDFIWAIEKDKKEDFYQVLDWG